MRFIHPKYFFRQNPGAGYTQMRVTNSADPDQTAP